LGDGKVHDAFDVWTILEHMCDKRQATKGAAELLGIKQQSRAKTQDEGKDNQAGPNEWKAPLPFPTSLSSVAPFDPAMLPEALREWVCDIADRMQCPPDFSAVGAIVALSSVIGRKRLIEPKRYDDWAVTPNLWGCVVGRPGVMKSPALAQVMRQLDRLQAKATEAHKQSMAKWEVDQELAKMSQKSATTKAQKLVDGNKLLEAEALLRSAKSAEEEPAPALRRYVTTDSSMEALAEILEGNPYGTLVYRDELSGLLKSLDREGQESARSFYLQAYDGNQGWVTDRIMRGKYRRIEAVCLSLLGGIQPGKIESYIRAAVSGGDGDDGLLQRFGMLVWPDASDTWKNVDRWPDTPAKNRAFEVFERLDALEPDQEGEPIALKFTQDAQGLFDEWRAELEITLRQGGLLPALESHLAKYRKLVPALALVCGLADGERDSIGRLSLMRALEWSEYLRTHAERAYRAGQVPDTQGAQSLLTRIRAKDLQDGFRTREIYLKGWSHLSSVEAAKAAVALLVDLNHIRPMDTDDSGIGRPTVAYAINPKTLEG